MILREHPGLKVVGVLLFQYGEIPMKCSLRYSSKIPLLGLASLLAAGIPSQLHAQTQVVAASVNGVLNPTQFAGADIGDQVNHAWASNLGKTVRIPPGSYSFSTTIVHP